MERVAVIARKARNVKAKQKLWRRRAYLMGGDLNIEAHMRCAAAGWRKGDLSSHGGGPGIDSCFGWRRRGVGVVGF